MPNKDTLGINIYRMDVYRRETLGRDQRQI